MTRYNITRIFYLVLTLQNEDIQYEINFQAIASFKK